MPSRCRNNSLHSIHVLQHPICCLGPMDRPPCFVDDAHAGTAAGPHSNSDVGGDVVPQSLSAAMNVALHASILLDALHMLAPLLHFDVGSAHFKILQTCECPALCQQIASIVLKCISMVPLMLYFGYVGAGPLGWTMLAPHMPSPGTRRACHRSRCCMRRHDTALCCLLLLMLAVTPPAESATARPCPAAATCKPCRRSAARPPCTDDARWAAPSPPQRWSARDMTNTATKQLFRQVGSPGAELHHSSLVEGCVGQCQGLQRIVVSCKLQHLLGPLKETRTRGAGPRTTLPWALY
jgi:hypothetical protein